MWCGGTEGAERKREERKGKLPRSRAGPTGPASSGKWGGRDRRRRGGWCGGNLYRRDREKKGREERKSATEQGRSHRSRTVREVGWEGQEKMCAVVGGVPR